MTLGLVPPEPLAEAVVVEFTVRGEVVGQGSMIPFVTQQGYAKVRPDNARSLTHWRTRIADEAQRAMDGRPVIHGAVKVQARFAFVRPQSHYGKRGLLPSAPSHRVGGVDLDKACRALFDALQGTVLANDALVVELHAAKVWGDEPGIRVRVTAL